MEGEPVEQRLPHPRLPGAEQRIPDRRQVVTVPIREQLQAAGCEQQPPCGQVEPRPALGAERGLQARPIGDLDRALAVGARAADCLPFGEQVDLAVRLERDAAAFATGEHALAVDGRPRDPAVERPTAQRARPAFEVLGGHRAVCSPKCRFVR
jgi:hypothetical protein